MTDKVTPMEPPGGLAPADRPMECSRDSLLKPPDWRYREAVAYLADERRGETPTAPSDPVVQYAVRALRSWSLRDCRKYMARLWPVMEEVLYYGTAGKRSAVAAEMDVCLIRGMRHTDADLAGCPVSREVYDLYASLFFDLSGIVAVHSWIQDFLFEPERHAGNGSLLRARLLAYYGDPSVSVGSMLSGPLSQSSSRFMSRLMQDERQRRLFDYVIGKTRLDPEVYSQIMEASLKSMSEHDFQEHMKDRDEAGSSSLEELAEHMEEGIRAFSQSEVAGFDRNGLDFVNQYTSTLTGRNANGKENKP